MILLGRFSSSIVCTIGSWLASELKAQQLDPNVGGESQVSEMLKIEEEGEVFTVISCWEFVRPFTLHTRL